MISSVSSITLVSVFSCSSVNIVDFASCDGSPDAISIMLWILILDYDGVYPDNLVVDVDGVSFLVMVAELCELRGSWMV